MQYVIIPQILYFETQRISEAMKIVLCMPVEYPPTQ